MKKRFRRVFGSLLGSGGAPPASRADSSGEEEGRSDGAPGSADASSTDDTAGGKPEVEQAEAGEPASGGEPKADEEPASEPASDGEAQADGAAEGEQPSEPTPDGKAQADEATDGEPARERGPGGEAKADGEPPNEPAPDGEADGASGPGETSTAEEGPSQDSPAAVSLASTGEEPDEQTSHQQSDAAPLAPEPESSGIAVSNSEGSGGVEANASSGGPDESRLAADEQRTLGQRLFGRRKSSKRKRRRSDGGEETVEGTPRPLEAEAAEASSAADLCAGATVDELRGDSEAARIDPLTPQDEEGEPSESAPAEGVAAEDDKQGLGEAGTGEPGAAKDAPAEAEVPAPNASAEEAGSVRAEYEDFDVPDAAPRRDAGDTVRGFRDSPLTLFEQDLDFRYVVIHNPPVLTEELILGKSDGDIFEPRDARRIIELKRSVLETRCPVREEIEVRLGGERSVYELLLEARVGAGGQVEGVVGLLLEIGGRKRTELALLEAQDRLERRIIELQDELEIVRGALDEEDERRRRAEEAIQALQEQDSLTGLPTRRVLNDRLGMALVHSRRQRVKFALALIGLDGFRGINESLGRAVGDDLLRSVSTLLEQILRQGDTVCRLGGDEFVLLLPGLQRADDVVKIAEKIRVSLRAPFTIGGRNVTVTASIGIAIFPDDGSDGDSLLHSAQVALGRAKEKGGDGFDIHAPQASARAIERLTLESALRRALVGNELILHYQPMVDAASGRIVAVEALLRLHNPGGGLVPASEFLRELDATSLAVPLGLWSLRAACTQVRAWREMGATDLSVAVNLTARQLLHPSLVLLVKRALGESGLVPEGLELEVAEADLVKSAEPALSRLAQLRQLGVRVAVDEFGNGEALLSRLQRFPVAAIKIDRSVIQGIETDEAHKGVAAAAIALARARHLSVVAEGVETEGQRNLLVRWRCDRLQGSLCGAPMPADELERLLAR